ncbi:MAG: threonine/serine exporter family protein [Bacteroidales bacterium]
MIDSSFFLAILMDGLLAAVAAIGFAIISNPPRQAIAISAFLAAVGHGARYFLMHCDALQYPITSASFIAAFLIGLLSIPFARKIHCPAEVFSFPSLLPMIPGMFAYKSILGLTKFLHAVESDEASIYLIDFLKNGFTAIFVLFGLVVGVAIPIFIFHRQSFSMTRKRIHPATSVK